MTQTPTIADYPAHAELDNYSNIHDWHQYGKYDAADVISEFNALLEENRRYRVFLQTLHDSLTLSSFPDGEMPALIEQTISLIKQALKPTTKETNE